MSVWTAVFSSSIALAAVTGLFYLVGGAHYVGYSSALGLSHLAGLQPNEYMFAGGEIFLAASFSLTFVMALLIAGVISGLAKIRYFPRRWEWSIFVLAVVFLTAFLAVFMSYVLASGRSLIKNGACPITLKDPVATKAFFVFWALIVGTGILSQFFAPRYLRLTLLISDTVL
ncbi:MAG: hypothetical protein JO182_16410, partial [Acidobacteriaceae bacterium]|nr:hypothetical protein [Acidobacteriaceae bacterium]